MTPLETKILSALVEAGGRITCAELRTLYSEKSDGARHAAMVRKNLTEWVRPDHNPIGSAIGVCITDAGRVALSSTHEPK